MSSNASKQGTRILKNLLRVLAKDERLHPSKRLLAVLLLGYIEGLYPFAVVESTYNKSGKVNWDTPVAEEQNKLDSEARTQLKNIFSILEEDENEPESSVSG